MMYILWLVLNRLPRRMMCRTMLGFFTFLLPVTATATTFGKNKVQYETLSWRYFSSESFDVYFHEESTRLAYNACEIMEDEYARLSSLFHFTHRNPLPLLLYSNPYFFQQTNVISSILPEGVGGFTERLKNRIVVPFNGSYTEFDHVLRHELVHAFQFGIMREHQGMFSSGIHLPLWFAEGSAEFLSSGWDSDADMFLMDKAVFDRMPSPGPGLSSGYMAYKGGQSFLYFLASIRSDSTFLEFLHRFRKNKNVTTSLEQVYDTTLSYLGNEWKTQLKQNYWPELGKRIRAEEIALKITSAEKNNSRYNLKPRISPDGKKLAFFTDSKDYTRIVIRDLENDKLLREINQFGYAGYFESFHPFRSGICWSPDGKKLAFVTKKHGRDHIRIYNVAEDRIEKTVTPSLDFIRSPDWSPDGNLLVYTGLAGDHADLYVYDISANSSHRITKSDMYEADPHFSPDGASIMYHATSYAPFEKSRNHTRLNPARTPTRTSDIFILTLDDTSTVNITGTPNINESQACFAGTDSIFFVSDKNGIHNIYCGELNALEKAQALTDFIGRCMNPDYSPVADKVTFTLFQKQRWDVWIIDTPSRHYKDSALEFTKWQKAKTDPHIDFFSALPFSKRTSHVTRNSSDTATVMDSTRLPLTDTIEVTEQDSIIPIPDTLTTTARTDSPASAHTVHGEHGCDTSAVYPYRLQFSPDMAALGVGLSVPYGYGGSGILVLSDLLGNHRIQLAADLQGSLDQTGYVFGSYHLLKYRPDFATAGFYDSRSYPYYLSNSIAWVDETKYGASMAIRYPFSLFARAGLDVYYSHIEQNYAIDYQRDVLVTDTSLSYQVIMPSAHYAFDNIVWGITGPVNGMRAHASVLFSPPVEKTRSAFISPRIDARHYYHLMRRFVFAQRIAMGASLPLGDKDIRRQYFMGGLQNWLYWSLEDHINLAHYDEYAQSSTYSEQVYPLRGWNYLALAGTKYALYNVAFRFPFVNTIKIEWPARMQIRYINGSLFADVGNAWFPEDEYTHIPLPNDIFGGLGFGLRVNLGLFVLKFDRAWKTDFSTLYEGKNYFSLGAEF